MKIFRDNVCYVEFEDLTRYGLPSVVFNEVSHFKKEIEEFRNPDAIKWLKECEYIVDYDYISSLSLEELDNKIAELFKILENRASYLLSFGLYDRKLKLQDKEENKKYDIVEIIYNCFLDYKNNKQRKDLLFRHIELYSAVQGLPKVMLTRYGKIEPDDFSPEYFIDNYDEDGFVENYCLSKEHQEQVKRLRLERDLKK